QANLLGGANTITLAEGARFTLTAANSPGVGGDWIANGLPVVAAGDDLAIVGNGDTIERGVSTEGFRLVKVAAGASLTLTDVTFQGGVASGSGGGQAAGGVIYSQGALTLDGVTVQNNIALGNAAQGGGIWSNGTLTLKGNSLIQNNQAIGIDAASSRYDVEA